MMNLDTLECVDVSGQTSRDKATFTCQVPAGNWKVMVFYLDPARRRGICDYLDPKAVDELIEVMYDQYYGHLKEYFGKVIKMSFYDEPSLHNAVSGRLWTAGYNDAFEKKFGYSPMKYYPALWYDIGPETAAARNALYGFRTELYAENFIGRIAAWCQKHGIAMSGHLDQEESRNPVGTQGDLMKIFKHQQIPGIDDIWFTGRSNVSYKVVTSAAYNYDRPLMMAETYAAYQPEYRTAKWVYRTAMDQHAMGVNLQIGGRPGDTATAEMGRYVGRMEYLLRHGRHVADIAILYPIAALQADYAFAQPVAVEPRHRRQSRSRRARLLLCPGRRHPGPGERLHGSGRDAVSRHAHRLHLPAPRNPGEQVPRRRQQADSRQQGEPRRVPRPDRPRRQHDLRRHGPEDPRLSTAPAERSSPPASCRPDPPSSSRISKSSRSSARCSAFPLTAR